MFRRFIEDEVSFLLISTFLILGLWLFLDLLMYLNLVKTGRLIEVKLYNSRYEFKNTLYKFGIKENLDKLKPSYRTLDLCYFNFGGQAFSKKLYIDCPISVLGNHRHIHEDVKIYIDTERQKKGMKMAYANNLSQKVFLRLFIFLISISGLILRISVF